ncbi:polymer-forming cytoskeletal protein [Sphingosinithalassobacter sp. CS137]|uniref:bactofilin family protein n=1 Tax=Sphingosinithalassobacter sp. CS137 TaxID=2762748 RepID=UPI0021CF8375|nr:polymer-forming cytoskeletal protein [Sphingosinithalassobacter sp. CS137]
MFSVLGPDVVVTGNVTATNDLHIDGRVEGDVNCGSLAQGSESQIFGSVVAESARLAGSIEGAVRVKQLTVERSAKITGDVEYENITIENGGHIDGRLKHMSSVDTSPRERPRAVESGSSSFVSNDEAA